MTKRPALIVPAVILGIVLLVVAAIYFAESASSLPSFFPGHATTGSEVNHHHTKHGIAALVVALACFAFAWFASGPKASAASA